MAATGSWAITFYGGLTEVWDIDTKERIASLYVESVDYPTGQFSALSPDGRTLATGGLSSLVNVWDVRTGRLVREIEHNVGVAIWALEFSPDGRSSPFPAAMASRLSGTLRAAPRSVRGSGWAVARR